MSYAASLATFFVPGTTGLLPEERAHIERNFPDAAKADGGVFTHDGLRTNYYVSRARNEKRVIIGFSGANAQFPVDINQMRYLNDQGCTLICMALPRVGQDFMQRSEKLIRAFLTNTMSPANALIQGGSSPLFMATHSTSGPILLKLLGEAGTGDLIRYRYLGIEFLSPFFDVPYASRGHSYITPSIPVGKNISIPSFQPFSALFEYYADRRPDVPINQRRLVKAYLAMTARKEGFIEKISDFGMTMGHIREIQNYSRDVMSKFHTDHMKGLTSLIMAGDSDPCTCWKTSRDIAARVNGKAVDKLLKDEFYLVAGGGHDLLKGKAELLDIFLKKADQAITLREEMRRASQPVYVNPAKKPEQQIEKLPPLPLRDRARLALQSGTRALYTTAGLL